MFFTCQKPLCIYSTARYIYLMDPIPINFKHNGVTYSNCYFTKIVRAPETSFWHLYDSDNYYLGKLKFTDQWTFDADKRSTRIDQLAEFFGEFVENANRSNNAA